jgi:hypothetical protein
MLLFRLMTTVMGLPMLVLTSLGIAFIGSWCQALEWIPLEEEALAPEDDGKSHHT